MSIERTTLGADAIGCHLDNHRGHYITRDMVELAIGYGYIVGGFVRYALDRYDDDSHADNYPSEELLFLADEALEWLNCGDNSGLDRAIKYQNAPPVIPVGSLWQWFDGDFGLYSDETDEES